MSFVSRFMRAANPFKDLPMHLPTGMQRLGWQENVATWRTMGPGNPDPIAVCNVNHFKVGRRAQIHTAGGMEWYKDMDTVSGQDLG